MQMLFVKCFQQCVYNLVHAPMLLLLQPLLQTQLRPQEIVTHVHGVQISHNVLLRVDRGVAQVRTVLQLEMVVVMFLVAVVAVEVEVIQ